MAIQQALVNPIVCPTAADLNDGGANSAGQGKKISEERWSMILKSVGALRNGVISGFTLPASDADLTIAVTLGEAIIDGYYIKKSGTVNITVSPNEEVYLYLRLIYSANSVVQAVLETSADLGGGGTAAEPTPPANSILLARIDSNGTAITSTKDLRSSMRIAWGSFKGYASGPRTRVENQGSGGWYMTNASGTGGVINFQTPFLRIPYILLFEVGTSTVTLALAASTSASAEITAGSPDEYLFIAIG